ATLPQADLDHLLTIDSRIQGTTDVLLSEERQRQVEHQRVLGRFHERRRLNGEFGLDEIERVHADVVQHVRFAAHHGRPRLPLAGVLRDLHRVYRGPSGAVVFEGVQYDGFAVAGDSAERPDAHLRFFWQGEVRVSNV